MPEIVCALGDELEVWAHGEDKPYIEGAKPLIKMNRERMGWMMESLPEARQRQIERILSEPPSGKVDRTLRDGEELPLYGGVVEVIHTSGHTPGYLSLFVRKEKLLIAGDALRVEQGELVGPRARPPRRTWRAPTHRLRSWLTTISSASSVITGVLRSGRLRENRGAEHSDERALTANHRVTRCPSAPRLYSRGEGRSTSATRG